MTFDRKFVLRNSPLTDLYKNEHIRSLHHLFLAGYLLLFVSVGIDDYLKKGRIEVGLRLIIDGFGKFHIAFMILLGLYLASCLVYLFFTIWARNRNFQKIEHVRLWDRFWTILVIMYHLASFVTVGELVTRLDLPMASSVFILIEQIFFSAKTYSFVRNNAARVSRHKIHSDDRLQLPNFSHFLYFLQNPPLVYSDSYPRNHKINWNFAFISLLEFFGALSFISLVLDIFFLPSVSDFGKHKSTPIELFVIVLKNTPPGLLIVLCFYYIFCHSWPNFMCELTRFGDRLFYEDWWNCRDMATFMRKVSMVPQDWLYFYVYKDLRENTRASRNLAKAALMLVSSIMHEYIAVYTFGFFCPFVMFLYWVAGGIILCLGKSQNERYNILFWMFAGFASSFLITMYGAEYFARVNVPIEKNSFIPRFLSVIT